MLRPEELVEGALFHAHMVCMKNRAVFSWQSQIKSSLSKYCDSPWNTVLFLFTPMELAAHLSTMQKVTISRFLSGEVFHLLRTLVFSPTVSARGAGTDDLQTCFTTTSRST